MLPAQRQRRPRIYGGGEGRLDDRVARFDLDGAPRFNERAAGFGLDGTARFNDHGAAGFDLDGPIGFDLGRAGRFVGCRHSVQAEGVVGST